jgi:hypothetical protein
MLEQLDRAYSERNRQTHLRQWAESRGINWGEHALIIVVQTKTLVESLGSFKVATYWPLKPLLISYLFVFYCQSTNKWM